ncbi:glycine rich domain-containing protein [Clostridioides sp. ZZV14-6105]|uniref:glycine rich domain-containing protein n=1 Tax=Clostridioides sp. ZZV14-6105 TaxID=2811492 RepID=UPI001D0F8D99|nr:hypothetical protein [Clostridioides sp. ZZV14-6105]
MATVYEFNYTGAEQNVTLQPGKYKLECFGACGGAYDVDSWAQSAKGGYTKGEIIFKEKTILYIYVGQSGYESPPSGSSLTRTGFGGGGSGGSMDGVSTVGGGATDIRIIGGKWDNLQGLLSRIIVAGGGGGSANSSYKGGNGGGLIGERGTVYYSYTTGGSQYQGGTGSTDELCGVFGKSHGSSTSKGGGGWFGGGSGRLNGSGGGSGYALTKDSYKPQEYIPTSKYYLENVVMTTGGNTTKADGYAKITLLQALPFLNIFSYNSIQATFKANHTDPTSLTKIEVFIDDILKETITTDLTTEKTINYTLEDNALHALKIIVTDNANTTAEKVVSISKNIIPLGDNASLQEIANKFSEMKKGLINGKISIVDVLALKNIEASLNNTLVELSEKIKTSFDSSNASVQDLMNQLTQSKNTITQLNSKYKFAYNLDLTVHWFIDCGFKPDFIIYQCINTHGQFLVFLTPFNYAVFDIGTLGWTIRAKEDSNKKDSFSKNDLSQFWGTRITDTGFNNTDMPKDSLNDRYKFWIAIKCL